jgi:hypothetical protein
MAQEEDEAVRRDQVDVGSRPRVGARGGGRGWKPHERGQVVVLGRQSVARRVGEDLPLRFQPLGRPERAVTVRFVDPGKSANQSEIGVRDGKAPGRLELLESLAESFDDAILGRNGGSLRTRIAREESERRGRRENCRSRSSLHGDRRDTAARAAPSTSSRGAAAGGKAFR